MNDVLLRAKELLKNRKFPEPIKIVLKQDKIALCCQAEFKAGDEVFFFRMHSKKRALIGVPYQGTYSLHKVKLNPIAYGLMERACAMP